MKIKILSLKNFFPVVNQGTSLIEVIIAVSIAVILFLIVTTVYTVSQNTYRATDTRAEISQNGRVIIDRIIRELRQSQEIATILPPDNSDPGILPDEIMFQDGHDAAQIIYIRYYLDSNELKRQLIRYYFSDAPTINVYWSDTDQFGSPPNAEITEDRVIGEFVDDIEFWGNSFVNVNLYLLKNSENLILNTAIYGRNL